MSNTPAWYGKGMQAILGGSVDLDTDAFKVSLHTSTYTPNRDTHDFFDDVTNELAASGGYTAGGVALSSLALSYDAATDQVRWDFADPVFPFTASKTWRYAVIRKARGGAASADELVALMTWDSDQTVSTSYTLQLDSLGLLYIVTT